MLTPRLEFPKALLLLPMVFLYRLALPKAWLEVPVVLNRRLSIPIAVLASPVVLNFRLLYPMAVLLAPVVLFWRAFVPKAVFQPPEELDWPALRPTKELVVISDARTSRAVTPLLFCTTSTGLLVSFTTETSSILPAKGTKLLECSLRL